jgi:hypothetical protein
MEKLNIRNNIIYTRNKHNIYWYVSQVIKFPPKLCKKEIPKGLSSERRGDDDVWYAYVTEYVWVSLFISVCVWIFGFTMWMLSLYVPHFGLVLLSIISVLRYTCSAATYLKATFEPHIALNCFHFKPKVVL